jgi:hypothetical protein
MLFTPFYLQLLIGHLLHFIDAERISVDKILVFQPVRQFSDLRWVEVGGTQQFSVGKYRLGIVSAIKTESRMTIIRSTTSASRIISWATQITVEPSSRSLRMS